MTIKKAIKKLLIMVIRNFNKPSPDECDAIRLGIEALKRIQDIRERKHSLGGADLPGETDE